MNTRLILLAVFVALTACGGGGEMEDEPTKQTEHVAPPPCKDVPVDQRQATCGS